MNYVLCSQLDVHKLFNLKEVGSRGPHNSQQNGIEAPIKQDYHYLKSTFDPIHSIQMLYFVGHRPNWTFNTNFVHIILNSHYFIILFSILYYIFFSRRAGEFCWSDFAFLLPATDSLLVILLRRVVVAIVWKELGGWCWFCSGFWNSDLGCFGSGFVFWFQIVARWSESTGLVVQAGSVWIPFVYAGRFRATSVVGVLESLLFVRWSVFYFLFGRFVGYSLLVGCLFCEFFGYLFCVCVSCSETEELKFWLRGGSVSITRKGLLWFQ